MSRNWVHKVRSNDPAEIAWYMYDMHHVIIRRMLEWVPAQSTILLSMQSEAAKSAGDCRYDASDRRPSVVPDILTCSEKLPIMARQ